MRDSFVLLHGAWHGGWCWRDTAAALRSAGHRVTTPTLTGLGERSHQLGPQVTLETMIADLANHILWEELEGAILVGHSFGGAVVTGAADRVSGGLPGRLLGHLKGLIYLDALWLEDGEAIVDTMDPALVAAREAAAAAHDGGLSLPAPPPEAFGITDPEQQAWLQRRLTPHPLATYREKLRLQGPPGNGLPMHYVVCNAPPYETISPYAARAAAAGLVMHDLAAPHDAMVTHPKETADLLIACAAAMG